MPDPQITPELIERYKNVTSASVYGTVRGMGYFPTYMRGVHAQTPGRRLVGTAKTLRFVPPRADIKRETMLGADSPEYVAMGSCGPGDVMVFDAMGKSWASIGGDVKLIQLKLTGAEGLITDGAIRDLDAVRAYGYPLFSGGRTGAVGEPDVWPFEANVTIQCGGVAVVPGDLIVADDDGVAVVPAAIAHEVIGHVEEHEAIEEYVKNLIEQENCSPGKYYPINDDMIARYRREQGS